VVAFERGACVYDIECKPKAKVCPVPPSKVHQMEYVPRTEKNILAVSTEDGRILFYDTAGFGAETTDGDATNGDKPTTKSSSIPEATLIAQLGGPATNTKVRIKDFEILPVAEHSSESNAEIEGAFTYIITTGCSDGSIRIWSLLPEEFLAQQKNVAEGITPPIPQVGQMLAKYDTGNRITCLKAFVMTRRSEDESEESEPEANGGAQIESSSDDSDD